MPAAMQVTDAPYILEWSGILVPNEGHNDDGKFIQFLEPSVQNQRHFRFCDPSLYDALRDIVTSGARSVTSVRNRDVLPPQTRYHDDPLSFDDIHGPRTQMRNRRTELRRRWLKVPSTQPMVAI